LVAGANTVSNGNTFVTISWNPVWQASSLRSSPPDYGLEIVCPDGGCTGLPCKIDPSEGTGTVLSLLTGNGADNAKFCTVTLSAGKKAQIVAFKTGSGGSGGDSDDSDDDAPEEEEEPTQQPTVEPTTTAQPTTSSAEPTTSTSTSSSSSSSTPEPTTSTSELVSETSSIETTTEEPTTTSRSSARPTTTPHAGIFHEDTNDRNHTSTASNESTDTSNDNIPATSSSDESAPASSSEDDEEGEAGRPKGNAALVSLVVAFIAAACFF
jgi:hypothetical protein